MLFQGSAVRPSSHSGATVPDSHRTSRTSANHCTVSPNDLTDGKQPGFASRASPAMPEDIRSSALMMQIQGLDARYVARMRLPRAGGMWGTVLAHPSAILLVVQLIGVLVYPFMEETGPGAVLFEIFGAVVLALAILSVRESAGPTWIAVTLAVVASGLSIVDAINPTPALDVASAVCHALFYFWAAGSLMVYMLSDRTVTTDELFAVGATFTLVAWGFAYVFEVVQTRPTGLLYRGGEPRGTTHLDGAAVPELHQPVQYWSVRCRPHHRASTLSGDVRAALWSRLCRALRVAVGGPDRRLADDRRSTRAAKIDPATADGSAAARGCPCANVDNKGVGVRRPWRAGPMGGVPAAQRAYRVLGERTREGMPGHCGCVWEERPKRSKSCVNATSEHGAARRWPTLLPRIRPALTPGCATHMPRRTAAKALRC